MSIMRALPALLMLLAPLPQAAQAAQWTKVGSTGGSASYFDKASVKRDRTDTHDRVYRATSLVSFDTVQSTPDGTAYRSMKAQHLYACERRTTTLVSQSYYPEPMGRGPVGQSYKYERFAPEPVAAGSAAEAALAIICAKGR